MLSLSGLPPAVKEYSNPFGVYYAGGCLCVCVRFLPLKGLSTVVGMSCASIFEVGFGSVSFIVITETRTLVPGSC